MSEDVKRAAGESAEIMNQIPEDKRAMAAKLAEAYACGLATGMEISENAAAEETAKNRERQNDYRRVKT